MDSFAERLKNYRTKELNLNTQKEMAEKLNISHSLYRMVERGARKPSKHFLDELVKFSNLPEIWWLYGVKDESTKIKTRTDFNCIKNTVLDLISSELIDKDVNFSNEVQDILLTALKADIKHLILKENLKKNQIN